MKLKNLIRFFSDNSSTFIKLNLASKLLDKTKLNSFYRIVHPDNISNNAQIQKFNTLNLQ